MFTDLQRDDRNAADSNARPVSLVSWPAVAFHLEASPWAGLYDKSDDVIHTALRGNYKTPDPLANDGSDRGLIPED